MTERDPMLRRIERNAIVACVVLTAVAAALARARLAAALGVVGGGALAVISYRGIKGGVDALVVGAAPAAAGGRSARVKIAIGLVMFFTRYAILAAVAYVIMARLRLPLLAVFAGASSLVVAIAIEAVQQLTGPQDRTGTD